MDPEFTTNERGSLLMTPLFELTVVDDREPDHQSVAASVQKVSGLTSHAREGACWVYLISHWMRPAEVNICHAGNLFNDGVRQILQG